MAAGPVHALHVEYGHAWHALLLVVVLKEPVGQVAAHVPARVSRGVAVGQDVHCVARGPEHSAQDGEQEVHTPLSE